MAQLIENKDRIIEAFADIRSSVISKGVTPTGDVSTYSQSILDIPQGYIGAASLQLSVLGTFTWTGTASNQVQSTFTLNNTGKTYFIQVGSKIRCLVAGTYCIMTGSCLIGNTNARVTTNVRKFSSEILSQSVGANNSVGVSFDKVSLSVNDEVDIAGLSSGTGTSSVKKHHYAQLFALL